LETAFTALDIKMGTENLFVNGAGAADVESNVERMDYIFSSAISARGDAGFAIFERGQNTGGSNGPFKVAAITGFDGNGLPTFVGSSIVAVTNAAYGNGTLVNPGFKYSVFRKTTFADTDLNTIHLSNNNIGPQGISGAFISLTNLVSIGTPVFGYAVLGADTQATNSSQLFNWDNPTYYPTNSPFSNDMDLVSSGAITYSFGLIISGNVYADLTADGTVNGLGTNAGGQLYAILVNSTGLKVDAIPVSDAGTFTLTGAQPSTNYTVRISTSPGGAIGTTAPTASLPPNWANTGENLGAGPGTDSPTNGVLSVPVLLSDIANANFGILPPGTIGNQVWADTNNDGLLNNGETGINGVTVTLKDGSGNDVDSDPVTGGVQPTTTVTSGNGNYSFTVLPGTNYKVVIQTPPPTAPLSSTTTETSFTAADNDDNGSQMSSGQPVSSPVFSLSAGVTNSTLDFGFVPTTSLASIGNQVWADANNDGLLNNGEVGINGVTLTLKDGSGNDVDSDLVTVGVQPTTTVTATVGPDAGVYSFSSLLPGNYQIVISTPPAGAPLSSGPTVTTDNAVDNDDNGSQASSGDPVSSPVFALAAGEADTTKDFGFVPTTSLASIGNQVWADANNDGLLNNGEVGINGVTLTLKDGSGNDVDSDPGTVGVQPTTVVTSGNGNYSFSGLPPGNYQIVISTPPTSAPLSSGPTVTTDNAVDNDDNGSQASSGQPVSSPVFALAAGETDNSKDFGFVPNSSLKVIGDYIWLDENGDGAQDAGESGIANVGVSLVEISTGSTVRNSVTDTAGGYLFTELKPNTAYRVVVDTATLPSGLAANQTFDPDLVKNSQTDVTTPATGEGVFTADFGYNWAPTTDVAGNLNTGAIGDRVWIDADGDGVQDPGEPGMGGVPVTLINLGADGILGTGDDTTSNTVTAADGSYIFDGLAAGAYVVKVNSGTTPTGYTQTGDPDGTDDNATTSPIVLAPGDVYVNADFGYQPDANTSGIVSGTVWLDANADQNGPAGTPGGTDPETVIAGVTVALIKDTNGDGDWDPGELIIATTVTDASGNYSFAGLPVTDGAGSDDYLVWVNDTGSVLTGLTATYDSNGTGTLNLSAATNLTPLPSVNDLQDFGYTPSGQTTGEGLIGDTVFLDTNNDGSFDAGDEGLEGVTVELYASDELTLLASTTTDENGNYWFGGLAADSYVVVVVSATLPNTAGLEPSGDPDGGDDDQSAVTLTPGQIDLAQDFGYKATAPHSISGTVWNDVNADGTLAGGEAGRYAGVTVVLRDSNGNIVSTTTTDGSGNYSFPGLPNGTYTLDVTDTANVLDGLWHSSGDQSQAVDGTSKNDPYTVVLNDENVTTADFGYYGAPAGLGDWVWNDTDNDGIQDVGETGIAGVVVQLTIIWPNASTTIVKTVTDADGYYSFDNLLLDENFDGVGSPEPTYTISIPTLPGTASPAGQGGDPLLDSGTPGGQLATVSEGVVNASYDFGFSNTAAGTATLSGFVYDDGGPGITSPGNTITGEDTPLTGVIVTLYNDLNSNGIAEPGELVDTTVTLPDGSYSFPNLANGNYLVVETDPLGTATSDFDTQGSPTDNKIAVALAGTDSTGNNFLDDGVPERCVAGDIVTSWIPIGVAPNQQLQITITSPYGLSTVEGLKYVNITATAKAFNWAGTELSNLGNLPVNTPTALPVGTVKVVVIGTRITNARASMDVRSQDLCGDFGGLIDPVITRVEIGEEGVTRQEFTGIPSFEHYASIQNGRPGLHTLRLIVNGHVHELTGLADGQQVLVDIGPAMIPGVENTVVLEGVGAPGSSALVVIADSPTGEAGAVQVIVPGLTLRVEQTAEGLELSWGKDGTGLELQSLGGLGSSSEWTAWPGAPVETGNRWVVRVPASSDAQFFRLEKK
jgi:hypothetical protein